MEDLFSGTKEEIKFCDGYYKTRFSEEQYKYLSENNDFRIRSLCSPNIAINLIPRSELRLIFSIEEFARDPVNVDIYMDKIFLKHIEYGNRKKQIEVLIEKEFVGKPLKIFLSNTSTWRIKEVKGLYDTLENTYKASILAFGDSITQGMETDYPSFTFMNLFHREGFDIKNQSVGGMIFDHKLPQLCNVSCENIFIGLGTNDILSDKNIDEVKGEIDLYFKLINEKFFDKNVVVLSPIPILKPSLEKRFTEIETSIIRVLKNYPKFKLVKGRDIFPADSKFYYDGDIHPNELGNFLIYYSLKDLWRKN